MDAALTFCILWLDACRVAQAGKMIVERKLRCFPQGRLHFAVTDWNLPARVSRSTRGRCMACPRLYLEWARRKQSWRAKRVKTGSGKLSAVSENYVTPRGRGIISL